MSLGSFEFPWQKDLSDSQAGSRASPGMDDEGGSAHTLVTALVALIASLCAVTRDQLLLLLANLSLGLCGKLRTEIPSSYLIP